MKRQATLAGGSSTRNSPQTLAPWLLMYYFVQHEGIVFATHVSPFLGINPKNTLSTKSPPHSPLTGIGSEGPAKLEDGQ
ncbi:hypothetical protein BDQ94DRAFT_146214 [Aspergillus welwitschiae]|uniref:Uncharacterized protein n=1 Tax=Aspergillus welwitschiae TaxID=1341132 RepID=A0A3F3PYM6_9EURO|nr:hypothetical protein BDQ94DRAFT_146214 [Aspergillus welwitschiae]RDH32005.1 hypothetical protein BDQ94DRAFT_146214 [Aspergillus welwitschiae]